MVVRRHLCGNTAFVQKRVTELLRLAPLDEGCSSVLVTVVDAAGEPAIVARLDGERISTGSMPESWLPSLAAVFAGPLADGAWPEGLLLTLEPPDGGCLVVASAGVREDGHQVVVVGRGNGTPAALERWRVRLIALASVVAGVLSEQEASERFEENLRLLICHVREHIVVLGADDRLLHVAPALVRTLGLQPADDGGIGAGQLWQAVHPADAGAVARMLRRVQRRPETPRSLRFRLRRADGGWRWYEGYASNLIAEPAIGGVLISLADVADRQGGAGHEAPAGGRSAMRGLLPRAAFERELRRRLADQEAIALAHIDVTGFRRLAGLYGHDAGEVLLRQVSARLVSVLQRGEALCHDGGGAFHLAVPVAEASMVEARAIDFLACFATPYEADGRVVPVSASCGFAVAPLDGATLETLQRAASAALSSAKRGGVERVVRYSRKANGYREIEDELASTFYEAIRTGALQLHFQAISDLASRKVIAYEGLLRWNHPRLGLLMPHAIFPMVDEYGFGDLLAAFCIVQAFDAIRELAAPVSINVSAGQLHYPRLVQRIEAALAQYATDPSMLILEVNESDDLPRYRTGLDTLRRIRDLGVRVALDHFGTGQADAGQIRDYPADFLKMDRQYIANGSLDENDAMITSMLAVASVLHAEPIAVGIEADRQVQLLRRLGCRYGQGFLLGRPMARSEIVGSEAVLALAG